jgi:hypothetical protein
MLPTSLVFPVPQNATTPTSLRRQSARWNDAFVPIDKIDVNRIEGWVTVKGEVDWQYRKRDGEPSGQAPGWRQGASAM